MVLKKAQEGPYRRRADQAISERAGCARWKGGGALQAKGVVTGNQCAGFEQTGKSIEADAFRQAAECGGINIKSLADGSDIDAP
ncbi:hypothetical protein D3C86_1485700 [compost metagenome]